MAKHEKNDSEAFGHVIFVTGPPSAGKTAVSKQLQAHTSTFTIVSADREIEKVPIHKRVGRVDAILESLLALIARSAREANVIVDAPLPDSFVKKTRSRHPEALFVGLRVSPHEYARRERTRTDREPRELPDWVLAAEAPSELFELVLDTTKMSAVECALAILAKAKSYWPTIETF